MLGVEWGGLVVRSCWASGERIDVTPVTRGVVGPGDERTIDVRVGEERAGEEWNRSAMGRAPTVDRLFIPLDYTTVM